MLQKASERLAGEGMSPVGAHQAVDLHDIGLGVTNENPAEDDPATSAHRQTASGRIPTQDGTQHDQDHDSRLQP
jgi:hypothetical protein